jgi:hypothetical protein
MPITPLRQRMIDDMTARHFSVAARRSSSHCRASAWVGPFDAEVPSSANASPGMGHERRYGLRFNESSLGCHDSTLKLEMHRCQ